MNASRREMLSAGALVVAFSLAPRALAQGGEGTLGAARANLPGSLRQTPLLDAWIRIDRQGAITVFTGKAELGQGIKTALVQVAAEELDVPPVAIRLVSADTERTPNEGVTAGSHSMQDSGTAILNAAANVRTLLAEAAAGRWGVAADGVTTAGDGHMKGPSGQSATYGELAGGLSLHVAARPGVPRRGGPHRTLGHEFARVDIPAKATGGQAYVQDLRLPGMLHARVARGRSDGARLKAPDVEAVEAMPGVVKVVRKGAFLAVVAERQWSAILAMRALQKGGSERAAAPLPADLQANLMASPSEDETILDTTRMPGPAPARQVKARYSRPWLIHGSIGPSCAVAQFEAGKLTVWTHTQGVFPLRAALAELTNLQPEQIHCIHTEGSGCYGHNGADDVAADAALIALAVPGRPVRLQWMREQEHGFEPLGTGMVVEIDAAIDGAGRIARWRSDIFSPSHNGRPGRAGNLLAGPEMEPPFQTPTPRPIPMPEGGGDRNGIPLYTLADAKVVSRFILTSPVRVSALRSLGGFMNVVAIECMIDELALAGGLDPVAFRLQNLDDPRAVAVIKAAADRFGWARREKGPGSNGFGFAFARYKNLAAYCAVAMQVSVDPRTGAVKAGKVVAAVDAGETVNPGGVRNQIEGAIVQAISWTGREAMGFDAAGRTGLDWNGYPILRFGDAPGSVDVQVIDRPGQPFLGAGEAGQGPAGAAFCNAVTDAIGHRLRDLPLSVPRIKAAIGA
ncbi:MAG TPA: molybdopterin cofactor-binding domain-containing protein [Caulobacteraceae bacterium]|jgi:CO/xanthine dehydrogenase Mo-binding subunit